MKLLKVTNIQRGCVYDGPGVRTTVFLKGCPLRCPWCCNPESQSFEREWYVDDSKCILFKNQKSKLCADCERVGGSMLIDKCLFGVSTEVSKDYEINDLKKILLKDKDSFIQSSGGVTVSGGEPLCHATVLMPLLKALNDEGVHVAIETSLAATKNNIFFIRPFIQLWIVDLKLQPQMYLENTSYLWQMKKTIQTIKNNPIMYRMVFVNEVLDEKETVLYAIKELGINKLELLLCHDLGKKKYQRLSVPFNSYSADTIKAHIFQNYLIDNNLETSLLTI